jgi:diguanylate cyclase (GGDEF)-like protein
MPGATVADAENRITELAKGIRELGFDHEDQVLKGLEVSNGNSNYQEHGVNYEEILSTANKALHRAKEEGRNMIVIAEKAQ